MQAADGVWYPMGGTRAVVTALHKLATELGCEFRAGEEVTGLDLQGGAVKGVRTSAGAEQRVDAVVSNMDAIRTYRELVGGEAARAYDRKGYEPACSGVVLYLGLSKRYEHLAHHDFVFSRDPEEEFDFIYKRGEPAPDPTCYLRRPSSTDPQRGARGRRGALRPGPHALPAPAPRLVEDASRPTGRRSSTS
jgi:phytoene dehydrogenase-like protein